jgi:integrase
MREKLTDRLAKTLTPGLYWDTHPAAPDGFLLQVTPAGARTYRLNYRRLSDGKERRLTVGSVAEYPSVAAAREKAAELRRAVREGRDPLGEREEYRAAPTIADLAARYVEEELPRLAPSSQAAYRSAIERRILPTLGDRKVSTVTRDDVVKLHRAVGDERNAVTGENKKRGANAAIGMLSILLNKAVEWSLREDNPVRFVKRHPEHGRERYLSTKEFERLFQVLDRFQSQFSDTCDATRLAMMTGARRGEILSMRVTDIDLAAAVWVKPASRTKQRRPHRVPLPAEAVELLQRRIGERQSRGTVVRLCSDDCVFEDGNNKDHVNRFEYEWRQIRAAAGLENCRFHDLRHSYASLLVSHGLSLPIISAMLGHSKPATTARYAHLADAPLREAAAIVGKIVGKGAAG